MISGVCSSVMWRPVSSSPGGGWGHAADLKHASIQPQSNSHHWEGLNDWVESIFYEKEKQQTSSDPIYFRIINTQTLCAHTKTHTNASTLSQMHTATTASLSILKPNQWLTLPSLLLMGRGMGYRLALICWDCSSAHTHTNKKKSFCLVGQTVHISVSFSSSRAGVVCWACVITLSQFDGHARTVCIQQLPAVLRPFTDREIESTLLLFLWSSI